MQLCSEGNRSRIGAAASERCDIIVFVDPLEADVYKRQYNNNFSLPLRNRFIRPAHQHRILLGEIVIPLPEAVPVSYTHLFSYDEFPIVYFAAGFFVPRN